MKRMEPEAWEKQLTRLPLKEGGFSKELIRKVKERTEVEKIGGRKRSSWLRLSPVLAAAVLMAAGLTQQEEIGALLTKLSKPQERMALEAMDKEKEQKLKVYYFHEDTFMANYGKAFIIRYPNTDLEIVSHPNGPASSSGPSPEQLIEQRQPDVLALTLEQYERMASEGKLYALDAVMKQDRYDLQGLYSGLTEVLRDKGGGSLYGLAPQYNQRALFYNKELFDKYGIPYPKDQMSWEELLQLAQRFPAAAEGDKLYGLTIGTAYDPMQLVQEAGRAKGLQIIDDAGQQVTVNTPEWKQLYMQTMEAYRKGSLHLPEVIMGSITMEELYKKNPFIMGKAAMSLQTYSYVRSMEEAQKHYKLSAFPWDLATEPVDPSRPKETTSFTVPTVYAVNAKSPNKRTAWELVKFIASDEMARKMDSGSGSWGVPARTGVLKTNEHRLEVFTMLKPAVPSSPKNVPSSFYQSFNELAMQQSQAVLAGRKAVDTALKELQEAGQQALVRAKAEAK
ncbi:ABC transporter substrate-binding protein [Paenibacillus silviterrae]|uniref:ABC transporter substrate-binding protein n=1 Tax=Paenibacillus silviterrae TaxID=3242194 RepID=UPI0025438AE7|nr:extracellular solute-binding protein [Paenibacillus chinjuensis]